MCFNTALAKEPLSVARSQLKSDFRVEKKKHDVSISYECFPHFQAVCFVCKVNQCEELSSFLLKYETSEEEERAENKNQDYG